MTLEWNSKNEPLRIIICKTSIQKTSLETEFHNYIYLKEKVPKSFLLLGFATTYLFLFIVFNVYIQKL